MKYTQVRYIPFITPVAVGILRDYVLNVNFHGDPLFFLIYNSECAESYQKYFEVLWKQAKK